MRKFTIVVSARVIGCERGEGAAKTDKNYFGEPWATAQSVRERKSKRQHYLVQLHDKQLPSETKFKNRKTQSCLFKWTGTTVQTYLIRFGIQESGIRPWRWRILHPKGLNSPTQNRNSIFIIFIPLPFVSIIHHLKFVTSLNSKKEKNNYQRAYRRVGISTTLRQHPKGWVCYSFHNSSEKQLITKRLWGISLTKKNESNNWWSCSVKWCQ